MGRRGQSGQAIVLIAIMLTVLIGMTAIAIDGSRAYALRRALQDAVDSAALAAADNLQQTGSYVTAEQAATSLFGRNIALYTAPSCSPGYGTPGPGAWTVTCTYSDGTVLTDVARVVGPQGSRFTITASRNVRLQFGRVLTNGASPNVVATSNGSINNLLYTPTLGALGGAGCGGTAGSAITVNGTGTLSLVGDVVSNGSISVAAGAVRVAGDVYARCQASVGGVTAACYPSAASTPCAFPDAAGTTVPGFRLPDPAYPAPAVGGSVGFPSSNVVVAPGVYTSAISLSGNHCWFLSGGVYEFIGGATNNGDFVSNELKPPDEPVPGNNTARAAPQFWDTNGSECAGAAQITIVGGPRGIPVGNWAFELTSVRTDTYGGVSYQRESAPSMCYPQNVNNSGQNVQIAISNVPGATSYNLYASPPAAGGTCTGVFGFAANIPVAGSVQNNNTTPCPLPVGGGCSLGNETVRFDSTVLSSAFTPNGAAAPGTTGAYPPDSERAPLAAGLPNLNPARGSVAAGDRANEDDCKSVVGAYVTCPGPVTPGAVELYLPAGGCLTLGSGGDTYLFSGYQYDWVSIYEPPGNSCTNSLGAEGNSAFIGLIYAPGAAVNVTSPYISEANGIGGIVAGSIGFTGTLPTLRFSAQYAPVAPAGRLTA